MGTMDYIALKVSNLNRQPDGREGLYRQWKPNGGEYQPPVALDCGGFQVRQGEIFGVPGTDRSDMSALVRCIAERLLADDSRITISGYGVLKDQMAVKRLINRVLANVSLFERLTPMESLLYGARLFNLGEEAARARAWTILRQMGLDEKVVHRPVGEMSACMQHKVAVACASLTQPAFLVLDEPTRGLPAAARQEVRSCIQELRDVYNATVLLTTRDPREAESLCDRVAILDEGQIVALDTPEGLKGLLSRSNGHTRTLAEAFVKLSGWVIRNQ